MEDTLTKKDVAGLLNKFVNKLLWVERTTYGKIYSDDENEVGIYGIWSGYLMTLKVEEVKEPGRFAISHYHRDIVNTILRTEKDVKAIFDEYILPRMVREYYSDVAYKLIANMIDEINISGKDILVRKTDAAVSDKKVGRTLEFGDVSIRFSYDGKDKFPAFVHQIGDVIFKYTPTSLSQTVEYINKDLMSKTKQYIESLN